jgi:hypothetical protein
MARDRPGRPRSQPRTAFFSVDDTDFFLSLIAFCFYLPAHPVAFFS